ncbi:DNA topoisomerase I [Candidatus Woesearchaeota archaeon]|nr:DNA topoisomerase I [Candidatus Woesearchaeota archaeon]
MMKYTLIITEKPNAANKIASALAEGKPIKEDIKGAPYYRITRGKKDIVVACAVGHLYGLSQKEGSKKWSFPVFDIEWQPAHEAKKTSAFSKKYLQAIKKLAKDADEIIVATDYDVEGEVIGLNVMKYACKRKDAERMKFSTLTKEDLIEAYDQRSKTLDWGQANAGEARHYLDFFNGVSYSRALTAAYKTTGGFKVLSIGRVQGPALKIIVDKEKEIKAFKPVPFWQIELKGEVSKGSIIAWHIKDKFWDKKEAEQVMSNVKGKKEGKISKVEKKQFSQMPPNPFDLTSLQVEAYRLFRIQPKDTLAIAQDLYSSGYISYPRTSSNQLPAKIGYSKILSLLAKQENYKELCSKLLKTKLKPNDGKKTDPAHPAIYPTGIVPQLDERAEKIYDLISRRFMATFGEPALRETVKLNIDVNKEAFIAKGTRTVEKGWFVYYGDYVKIEEEELPKAKEDDTVDVKKITMYGKETLPPKRYTPASIIKELEKKGLGTKATRASIIDTLFQRNYVHGQRSIEATELGINTIKTLEEYVPKIIDEEMTRHFEDEMEDIRENKKKKEDVLKEAKAEIAKVAEDFRKHEKEVGESLKKAHWEAKDAMATLGSCPKCKKGILMLRKGKFGNFAACNAYPGCKTTFSLPNNAVIKPSKNICKVCGMPMVLAIKKKKPMEFCLNPDCKSKHVEGEAGELAKGIAKGDVEKPCPKCKKGKLVLRKSIYGSFLGCSSYPKCRYTERLDQAKKEDVKPENNKNK